jgi:hypothetical protein
LAIQDSGSLSGSNRVGFNTRSFSISIPSNLKVNINGNYRINVWQLGGAFAGQNATRYVRLRLSGNGLDTGQSGVITAPSTTSTTASFTPGVGEIGITAANASVPQSGNFTMGYTAYANAAGTTLTNNLLESGTTTDDIRVGLNGASTGNYWSRYRYYTVASPPSGISASHIGSGVIRVTWTAPSDASTLIGTISSYTVERSTTSDFASITSASASSTSYDTPALSAGTYFFRVYANSDAGTSARSGSTSASVPQPVPAPTWNTTTLNQTVYVGTSYSIQLSANNTSSYSLASGSLPAGLSLSSSGLISGTVSAGASQTFNFIVRATNSDGVSTNSNTFTLNRRQALPTWIDDTLSSDLRVGVPYSDSVQATNFTSYSVSGLPSGGLSFSSGDVSGTPTVTSTISFTITATNSDGATSSRNYNLTPKPAFAVWTKNTLTSSTAKVGQQYSDFVAANNASSYGLQSGTLPPGIALNTITGDLSGVPTEVGTYNFVLRASNSINESIFTSTLTITVEPGGSGKIWNGSQWVLSTFKVWTGSAWTESPAKVWNGSAWVNPIT